MASFFSWQLKQRKGPSHGREFWGFDAPSCTEIPSPGFISTWHTAHMNNLNILQSGYFVSNLHFTQTLYCQEKNREEASDFDNSYNKTKQNLSESIAEPSSYSSTTTSGSMYSLSIEVDSEDFLRNMALSIPFTGFFCIGTGAGGFSWGNISTTMQVVSSLSPFACKASWR